MPNNIKIKDIPYKDYIEIMNKRKYDIKKIIDYTILVYGIDIRCISQYSKYIDNIVWNDTIYDFPKEYHNSHCRKFFNNTVKPNYIKFINNNFQPKNLIKLDDMLFSETVKADVFHHIHPLIFGGTNDYYNLIPITEYNHKLLHMNPYETKAIKCFQAIDYLTYLYMPKSIKQLYKKYFTKKINNQGLRFINEYWKIIYKEEMLLFYFKKG